MKKYWTIVFADTLKPVPPLDSFDSGDIDGCEGMMVFCNEKDAEKQRQYQEEKYGEMSFDGRPIKVIELGKERCCIPKVKIVNPCKPWTPGKNYKRKS